MSSRTYRSVLAATFVAVLGIVSSSLVSRGEDTVTISVILENDAFTPAEILVPANKPFVLKILNKEKAGVEIEAKDLKIEKVVAPESEMTSHVRPLKPGRYLIVNEYKEDSVKAYVVVQ